MLRGSKGLSCGTFLIYQPNPSVENSTDSSGKVIGDKPSHGSCDDLDYPAAVSAEENVARYLYRFTLNVEFLVEMKLLYHLHLTDASLLLG